MSDRVFYLDGLRVFAILAVIIVHVTCMFYTRSGLDNWYAACAYGSFSRWCVPVFCMISGALFLNKRDLLLKDLYLHYIKRIVIAFVFWSSVYVILYSTHPFMIKSFVGEVIHGHYHLWFLYMICGLYIMMPIFRYIFANKAILRYYLSVSFVVAFFIPFVFDLSHSFGIMENFIERIEFGYSQMNLQLFLGYSTYFLLGGVFRAYTFTPRQRSILYIAGIACGLLIWVLTSLINKHRANAVNETFYCYTGLLVCFLSVSVFVFAKYSKCFERISRTMMTRISNLVFGVYLVHVIILDNIMRVLSDIRISAWIVIPLISLCVFIISLFLVWLLRKFVPYAKYIL